MTTFPYSIIDLTHSLDCNVPAWENECGFFHEMILDYKDCDTETKFRVHEINMKAGIGTHIDAPAHCIPGGVTIDQLPLQDLIVPCIVIDVSSYADENYILDVPDIERFEKKYGQISPKSFVIIRTGWDKFWNDPIKYRNNYIFPSVSESAAEYLLKREIVGIGVDTLSPDIPGHGYKVHAGILGAGKYIVENIANAEKLPIIGSLILILPINIKNGTEAPVRLIGLVNP